MRSPVDVGDLASRRPAGATAAARRRRAPAQAADSHRRILAMLRWRAHLFASRLPARTVLALRLLPALLHAGFEPALPSREPPGVAGARYRRRWSSLARALGLPPPSRVRRGPARVEAILAVPLKDGVDVVALVAPRAATDEVAAVRQRLADVETTLARAGVRVRARALEPDLLALEPEAVSRVVALGTVLAGRIGRAAWEALEVAGTEPLAPERVAALAAHGPGALGTLALTLLAHRPAPGALAALRRALREGAAPSSLVDPELFCVEWAGQTAGVKGPLERVTRAASSGGAVGTAELLQLGGALALRCARVIRTTRGIDAELRRAWRQAVGAGFPRVLLPALGERIAAAGDDLALAPALEGRVWTVRLPDGAVVGRGAGPVQARVRAVALVTASRAARGDRAPASAIHPGLDPTWRLLARRLSQPYHETALLLLVHAGTAGSPEPPFDPLNRGTRRDLDFEGALAVHLGRQARPSGRMLNPMESVETALRYAGRLEVLAPRREGTAAAGRIARVASLARRASEGGPPIAIEAGGRVLVPRGGTVLRYALRRFAARPRTILVDPDAPDLSLSTGSRSRGGWRADNVVQCRVTLPRPGVAALLFVDAGGAHLREEVEVAEVEARLAEARAIVRQAAIPAVVALRLGDDLAPTRHAARATARVDVAGELPWIEVAFAGERFGAGSGLRWGDAAEAILSAWPPGVLDGRVAIGSVAVTVGGAPAPALALLWAATVARRRLRTHLERAMSTYRAAAMSRRGK